jgi:DNA-binding transcriptional regulator YdaS (Cro superfamily)
MTAAQTLDAFVSKKYPSRFEAAVALGVSPSSLHYWLRGASKPRVKMREKIERWTRGAVRADAWAA